MCMYGVDVLYHGVALYTCHNTMLDISDVGSPVG